MRKYREPRPLEEILIVNSPHSNSHTLRLRLIKCELLKNECAICALTHWQNRPLSLHLDHVNGNNRDHRLENLRLLCPNCHSQTESYCRRKPKPPHCCCDCKKVIYRASTRCKSCALRQRNKKIEWPPAEEIVAALKQSSYSAVGRALGVSDNAVRKHLALQKLLAEGLEPPTIRT